MVKNIVKDDSFLALKSEEATILDINIANDLLDTLKFNASICVGMAANMIGELKRIIAFNANDDYELMFNPIIIKATNEYITYEGCLCRSNKIQAKRHKNIKVEYFDIDFKKRIKSFSGFTAEIIEHEIDHINGIIV